MSMSSFSLFANQPYFADVVLPLAIPRAYTYAIPIDLFAQIQFGVRVEVPIKNKLYAGIVVRIHQTPPAVKTRQVLSVLDTEPIIHEEQFAFWEWMSSYYCAHLGEIMYVAMPSAFKLSSDTVLVAIQESGWENMPLTDDEYLLAEALSIRHELSIAIIQDILNKKTIYPVIKTLMQKRVLAIREEMQERYFKKKEDYISVVEPHRDDITMAFELVSRSELQQRALLAIFTLHKRNVDISKKQVFEMTGVTHAVLQALVKKGIIDIFSKEISRLNNQNSQVAFSSIQLSSSQQKCLERVRSGFEEGKPVLLHGITGSGKTQVYLELIKEVLENGGQVLYLLPEIALTSQIVSRLQDQLKGSILVFHSKINDQKRVEIWQTAMTTTSRLFIGARSAVFLPFANLKLIIVDEEHDPSYKQNQPNPKYNARDAAIMLAHLLKAKVLLGSATPSLESLRNASMGKYHFVQLLERFGLSELPTIELVNMRVAQEKGLVKNGLSTQLIDAIKETIARGEQVIIFQNRRGYAPILKCELCGWTAECTNCDITLTFHQAIHELKCHSCGYRTKKPSHCAACGHAHLKLLGIGTEKVEELLQKAIPKAKLARFDHDSTRSKKNQDQILLAFEAGELDILVGTQMITKGFDFDRISLVGVISADGLLNYPDFRSSERGFQLLMQVSGRAGRRERPGKVIIQGYNLGHPVLKEIMNADYATFAERESQEREFFRYPPYYFLTEISLSHKELERVKMASRTLSELLKTTWGNRIIGPVDPSVLRRRSLYHQTIFIKYEKRSDIAVDIKRDILNQIDSLQQDKEYKSVYISIDVDPY